MPDPILIGNFPEGLITAKLPPYIDNNSFPTMFNFYSWRGRAKRKRGTIFLGQLQRQLASVTIGTLNGSGNFTGNLISIFSLGSTATIASKLNSSAISPISLSDGTNTYTEPSTPNGALIGTPAGAGTINYATGAITIAGGAAGGTLTGAFSYYPGLPVMGLEDYFVNPALGMPPPQYPILIAFDTTYAYQINQTNMINSFYNVSYYKITNIPFVWSGQNYQQFWSTNYSSAFWATNNKPGFHFVNGTYVSGSDPTTVTFNFKSGGANFTSLIVGDVLWFNEWAGGSTINGISGAVSSIAGAASGNYVVTFSSNQTVSGTGIAELLTNSIPGQDGIKWYDGDPTNKTGIPTGTGMGWVNFAPPLTATNVIINNLPLAKYYLVGALAIVAFKDRLVFFGAWVQTSSGSPILLQDTVIWSWDGTPYYASTVPINETFNVIAYYVDQTGAGGYLSAGISQAIATINNNEDVILVGFTGRQTRFVFTGNDLQPFLFYNINSELGSSATYSGVTLDKGALTIGTYGIAMTDQQSAQRIDLQIPDSVFQIQANNNGMQRVNGARDYYREWVYFCYPTGSGKTSANTWVFPSQTFFFNYRENTWAIFRENFTAHGSFRRLGALTWATLPYRTWGEWREAWGSATTSAQFPSIVAGNPQGYVLIKGENTGEGRSGTIQGMTIINGELSINSINHCVNAGDYLYFSGILGPVRYNGQIGMVTTTPDANNFTVNFIPDITPPDTTPYLGLGNFTRLSQPVLQTKQFNPYWEQGRQVRLGTQKYLLDFTASSQITVNIYLSQGPNVIWNAGSIVPTIEPNPTNSALIYSQTVFTCPESTNIGLTPANTNLQMPTASSQRQIWHRMNTSLIGDTFQIGLTLSDAQMRNLSYATNEITIHAAQFDVNPGPLLS